MSLKVKVPEDFKPSKLETLRKSDSQADVQWWVYTEKGTGKKYTEASSEEVHEFAMELYDEFPVDDCSRLGLLPVKSTVLDICLDAAIDRSRNLFGGSEFWDKLEDWERASLLAERKDKKS